MNHISIICLIVLILAFSVAVFALVCIVISNDIRNYGRLMKYSRWRVKKVTVNDKIIYYPQVNILGIWCYFDFDWDLMLGMDCARRFYSEIEAVDFVTTRKKYIESLYNSKKSVEYINL